MNCSLDATPECKLQTYVDPKLTLWIGLMDLHFQKHQTVNDTLTILTRIRDSALQIFSESNIEFPCAIQQFNREASVLAIDLSKSEHSDTNQKVTTLVNSSFFKLLKRKLDDSAICNTYKTLEKPACIQKCREKIPNLVKEDIPDELTDWFLDFCNSFIPFDTKTTVPEKILLDCYNNIIDQITWRFTPVSHPNPLSSYLKSLFTEVFDVSLRPWLEEVVEQYFILANEGNKRPDTQQIDAIMNEKYQALLAPSELQKKDFYQLLHNCIAYRNYTGVLNLTIHLCGQEFKLVQILIALRTDPPLLFNNEISKFSKYVASYGPEHVSEIKRIVEAEFIRITTAHLKPIIPQISISISL